MKVIVGLGNPGKSYELTRHNVGFLTIDKLADLYGIEVIRSKHRALLGDKIINGEKLILVKPMTFMNLSGESVIEIMKFYKLSIGDIIIIYDDTSLPVGNIRVRENGSDGGHNGMKSLIFHFGSADFTRIRIGIGEKPHDWDLADYVLSKFTEDERIIIDKAVVNAADCAKMILNRSVSDAMNKYNRKTPSKKPEIDESGETQGEQK